MKKAENVQKTFSASHFSLREVYRLQSRDNFNFYQHTLGQVCYANTASCRLCIAHSFGVHFIECTEIPCDVLEEASRLDNLVKAGACGFQNGFQVPMTCLDCPTMSVASTLPVAGLMAI